MADNPSLKELIVHGVVRFRTSFVYLYIFMALIGVWIGINVSGVARWDNPEFTYLNIAISILTELQSVILLIYVTRIDDHNKARAEIDHRNIEEVMEELTRLSAKLDDHLKKASQSEQAAAVLPLRNPVPPQAKPDLR